MEECRNSERWGPTCLSVPCEGSLPTTPPCPPLQVDSLTPAMAGSCLRGLQVDRSPVWTFLSESRGGPQDWTTSPRVRVHP